MRILCCNDDGYRAEGINTMANALRKAGHDVLIVAPSWERSGQSHALSFNRPLVVERIDEATYSVEGTPADCAVVGLLHVWREKKPDLVISGINHGLNVGWDVNYSGTVGAATEATFLGVPAVAISADIAKSLNPSQTFREAADLVVSLINAPFKWPRLEILNVNYPAEKSKGVKVALCEGSSLYIPNIELCPNRLISKDDKEIFLIGGHDRTSLSSLDRTHDVSLVQQGYATLSFIKSRQSTSENNGQLDEVIAKL